MLRRYHRMDTAAPWRPVGAPVTVSLGRRGLGWGRGLHGFAAGSGPVKREGDGRSPAGAFALEALFGYPDRQSLVAKMAKLPYWAVTPEVRCVDDPESIHYNRIVNRQIISKVDWISDESMLREDNLYSWGVVVAHNAERPVPGAGSCIFLHVWRGEGQPTAGCTASDAGVLAEIFLWLRADERPVLVQLPQSEYERLRASWLLP